MAKKNKKATQKRKQTTDSKQNNSQEKPQFIKNSIFFGTIGGIILGLVKLLVDLHLFGWFLPNDINYLGKIFIYPLIGLSGGGIFGVLLSTWCRIKPKSCLTLKTDCFCAAASIVLTTFLLVSLWTYTLFDLVSVFKNFELLHLFYNLGLFLLACLLAFLIYSFIEKQKEKNKLVIGFTAISAAFYTFIEMYFTFTGLIYNLTSLICGILIFIVTYYVLLLFNGLGFQMKLFGGFSLATILIVSVLSLPKVLNKNKAIGSNPKLSKDDFIYKRLPNILLITPDALRHDHLGCYGYKRIKTPNIDSLAENGVMFKNVISASSWTTPSFASLFTSVYPTVHGAGRMKYGGLTGINQKIVMLAEILKKLGYHTRAITDNGSFFPNSGIKRGFDYYINNRVPSDDCIPVNNPEEKKRTPLWKKQKEEITNITIEFTMEVSKWLEENNHYPFFYWVHYLDPHTPYERYMKYGLDKKYNGQLLNEKFLKALDHINLKSGLFKLGPDDKKYFHSLYEEEIMFLDGNVGTLVNKLEQLNLLENTIIIFTSDHGEEFWDHGHVLHGQSLYQELINVPLIIRLPGKKLSNLVVNSQIRSIDIMPTILDMLGTKHNLNLMGKSLIPLITGEETNDRTAFSENLAFFEERKSINKGKYKFIYFPESGTTELYDLSVDPKEKENIADEKPVVSMNLKEEIIKWMKMLQNYSLTITKGKKSIPVKLNKETKDSLRSLGYLN